MRNWISVDIIVNFYLELVCLTFISRNLMFIFSTNKSKFLKQLYNMSLLGLMSNGIEDMHYYIILLTK